MSKLFIDILSLVAVTVVLTGAGAFAFGFNQGYKKAYFRGQDMTTKANFISIDTKKKGGKK